jgi:hypothetical protein
MQYSKPRNDKHAASRISQKLTSAESVSNPSAEAYEQHSDESSKVSNLGNLFSTSFYVHKSNSSLMRINPQPSNISGAGNGNIPIANTFQNQSNAIIDAYKRQMELYLALYLQSNKQKLIRQAGSVMFSSSNLYAMMNQQNWKNKLPGIICFSLVLF